MRHLVSDLELRQRHLEVLPPRVRDFVVEVEIQLPETLQTSEVHEPCVGDPRLGQVQSLERNKVFEVGHAFIVDPAAQEAELFQACIPRRRTETGAGDLGQGQTQLLQPREILQMFQADVGDRRSGHGQPAEFGESLQVDKSGIADLCIVEFEQAELLHPLQVSQPRVRDLRPCVVRGFKQGQNRGQKRATLSATFFRRDFPSLYGRGSCGEKMFPDLVRGGSPETAKVARFENAADIPDRSKLSTAVRASR